ncbi:MAG: ceramidase [Motiliproteus sp.]|nr:ceramidase [Motiliproteus sp.]MCW9053412.1 ceramidase [Motiliproteus sp.]
MIDLYCERLGPELLAEPVNALTNLSFLVAAWASWKLSKRERQWTLDIWLLIALMAAIGLGSALFHTFATYWAQLADVIPIMLFQVCFLVIYSRRVIGLSVLQAAIAVVAFFAAGIGVEQFSHLLNGSLAYAPAFLVLLILGIYQWQQRLREPYLLLAASTLFLVSLSFRTMDNAICPNFELGTHFLWHLLNGLLLYWLLKGLVVNIAFRP